MDLIKELNKNKVLINDSFIFKERELINRKDELGYSQSLNFGFKEMKIDKEFIHIITGSLSERIKADCFYKAQIFYSPWDYNDEINSLYNQLETKIEELYKDIQKGGLFNSDDRMNNQVKGMKEHYKNLLKDVEKIKKEYEEDSKRFPRYDFGCSVYKLENSNSCVRRVDFILGQEAFLHIATNIKDLDKYELGLTPEEKSDI